MTLGENNYKIPDEKEENWIKLFSDTFNGTRVQMLYDTYVPNNLETFVSQN